MSGEIEIQALTAIAQRACQALNADRCTIFALDPGRQEVVSLVALKLGGGGEIRMPVTRGAAGFVARTGRPLRLRDAYTDPRFDPSIDERTGYRTKNLLTVPITNGDGTVLGVLQMVNKLGGTFSTQDERDLAEYCAEAAAVLASGS